MGRKRREKDILKEWVVVDASGGFIFDLSGGLFFVNVK